MQPCDGYNTTWHFSFCYWISDDFYVFCIKHFLQRQMTVFVTALPIDPVLVLSGTVCSAVWWPWWEWPASLCRFEAPLPRRELCSTVNLDKCSWLWKSKALTTVFVLLSGLAPFQHSQYSSPCSQMSIKQCFFSEKLVFAGGGGYCRDS